MCVIGRNAQGEQIWSAVSSIATAKVGMLGRKQWANSGPEAVRPPDKNLHGVRTEGG